jgi:hypothetical protein
MILILYHQLIFKFLKLLIILVHKTKFQASFDTLNSYKSNILALKSILYPLIYYFSPNILHHILFIIIIKIHNQS